MTCKSLLAFSLKSLASFTTVQSSCLATNASALVLPGRRVLESVDPTERFQAMAAELRPHLSSDGLVYFVGSEELDSLTERWQLYAPPTFIAVVEARSEKDVQHAVSLYAVKLAQELN
jgi:hypothetical protein